MLCASGRRERRMRKAKGAMVPFHDQPANGFSMCPSMTDERNSQASKYRSRCLLGEVAFESGRVVLSEARNAGPVKICDEWM